MIQAPGPVVETSQSFTVSAWVKLDDKATARIVVGQLGNNRLAFYLGYSLFFDRWVIGGVDGPSESYAATSNATLMANTWTHLAGVYNAVEGKLTLYVDGTAQTAVVSGIKLWSGKGKFTFGGEGSSRFKGAIDDVQAYQRVLTPAEIVAVRDGRRSRPTPPRGRPRPSTAGQQDRVTGSQRRRDDSGERRGGSPDPGHLRIRGGGGERGRPGHHAAHDHGGVQHLWRTDRQP